MNNIILSIIIFGIVFFLYLHIYYHFKINNDLEILTIDGISKDTLEDVCNLRQPTLFKFQKKNNFNLLTFSNILKNYPTFDIKIKNTQKIDELPLPVSIGNAITLFNKDSQSKFYTCNNDDFLQESGIKKIFKKHDMFLRPPLVSNCQYDFNTGSINCNTPLQYEMNYRNYIFVNEGTVTIKLIPPIYTKYLYSITDYDNFEFRSPIHPWNVQDKYLKNFSKVKFLELDLNEGDIYICSRILVV